LRSHLCLRLHIIDVVLLTGVIRVIIEPGLCSRFIDAVNDRGSFPSFLTMIRVLRNSAD